jgi:hypothetical protein
MAVHQTCSLHPTRAWGEVRAYSTLRENLPDPGQFRIDHVIAYSLSLGGI